VRLQPIPAEEGLVDRSTSILQGFFSLYAYISNF
jgi:hypothetical protein